MNKRDIFILNEVIACIRKAKTFYLDAGKEKDLNASIRWAVEANNYIEKSLIGLQSILNDIEED